MSDSGQLSSKSGPVVPPVSRRTIMHPSFLPLSAQRYGGTELQPILPEEVFYIDPSMNCGKRIPNFLTRRRVFDFSRLNTPQPIMSSCMAPPNQPDLFRSGPHPIRDLGSLSWSECVSDLQPPRVVIQLSQEEDQAITNLLKLHHQGAAGNSYTGQTVLSILNCTESCGDAALMSPAAPQNHQSKDVSLTRSETHVRSRFSCNTERGDVACEENRRVCRGSEVRRSKELTDLEVNAVHVLLSLRSSVTHQGIF